MLRTLLYASGIFFILYLYLGLRLAGHVFHWILLLIPFLLILSFPFKRIHRIQIHLIYLSMGVLSYLTIFTILRDVILVSSGIYIENIFLFLTVTCFISYGTWKAMKGPCIKKVDLMYPGLLAEFEGLTIAQVSDLHVGPTIGKRYVQRTVNLVNSLLPDLVALTGDIGDGPPKVFRNDIAPLSNLRSTLGTFYVPGNHEYYWGINEWLGVMNNLGAVVLVNRGKMVEFKGKNILVGGIPDPVASLKPDLLAILETGIVSELKILLSHRPEFADEASKLGYDLQLSGHTHGGQFFPWTLVIKYFHEVTQGLKKKGNMWLYVSPGTGSWGPLLRLGTTPEITLFTFKKLSIASK